jgi:DNA transformation protein and related proteins
MARKARRKSIGAGTRRELTRLTTSRAFAAFVVDQLSELGDVTARRMFGGVGLYLEAVFFGVIARDVLYFKTDELTRPAYVRLGMKPFMPYDVEGAGQRRYYAVPLDVLENPPALAQWARAAAAAATRLRRQPTGTRAPRNLKRR